VEWLACSLTNYKRVERCLQTGYRVLKKKGGNMLYHHHHHYMFWGVQFYIVGEEVLETVC
jgi:ubiquinone/menaquinone biosynthesis C-methylase UbiE